MKVIFSPAQKEHDPQAFFVAGNLHPHPEVPARAEVLLAAAEQSGLIVEEPSDYKLEFISAVHTPRYLHYFENIFTRWSRIKGGSHEVIPGVHPDRRDCGYPASAEGQVGFHHADLSSPIGMNTWHSALWSAHTAAHAGLRVVQGDSACYALSRPPGPHAARDYAAGFCYLGNTAIAATVLQQDFARVAILDIDVHHGNGTQDIFYDREDVLTVSIHADPVRFYPFFWGHANERGIGAGEGFNVNLPLVRGTADDDYLQTLSAAIDAIDQFSPDALVIALGLDAFEGDPLQGLAISTSGFGRIGKRIAEIALPTVIVQEGGYLSNELGTNLSAFLEGFIASHKT
jgi:acetoin utilization deacetylase AcuC-like enzyme